MIALAIGCQGLGTSERQADDNGGGPAELTGDVTLYGCTPRKQDITVFASTSDAAMSSDQTMHPPPKRPKHAVISPTNDPHVFRFAIHGLSPRETYRLGAGIDPQAPCAKIVWQGPSHRVSVATAGQLHIAGFAMRTQVEVQAMRQGNPVWVGIDAVNLNDPQGAIRTLRWRTDVPGAVAGLVEISADKFPLLPDPQQQHQPLILASFQVPMTQGNTWSQLPPIDFRELVKTCDPQSQDPTCTLCDPQSPNGCPSQIHTVAGAVKNGIRSGAPVYVRVSLVAADGHVLNDAVTGGIASYAKLAHLPPLGDLLPPPPPPPVPPLLFNFIHKPAIDFPPLRKFFNNGCYRVIEDHTIPLGVCDLKLSGFAWVPGPDYDAFTCGLVQAFGGTAPPGSTLTKGTFYCENITHDDGFLGGFFSDLADAVSGFIDEIGSIVDDISHLYEQLKKDVINALGSVVSELGIIDCGEGTACHAALEAAVDAGLAAMGLPPSLPNWQALKDEGLDYLKEEAAEETGVPREAIDALESATEKALANMETPSGHAGLPDWVVPDDGFAPISIDVSVQRNPDYTGPSVPNDLTIVGYGEFLGAQLRLPGAALDAGKSFHLPIQLLPDVFGIDRTKYQVCGFGSCVDTPNTEAQVKDEWYETRFLPGSCLRWTVTGAGYGYLGDSRVKLVDFGPQIDWFVISNDVHVTSNPFKQEPPACVLP